MTQATDVDIRELKDLILGLDKKIDAIDRESICGRCGLKSNKIHQLGATHAEGTSA